MGHRYRYTGDQPVVFPDLCLGRPVAPGEVVECDAAVESAWLVPTDERADLVAGAHLESEPAPPAPEPEPAKPARRSKREDAE